MSSGGCWRTTRASPVRRATRPCRRLATGPRRWTCCSGRARDDRDCHSRSEPWWPGGAGDAGQDEAARVAVPVPGPARRGVLAGRRPGPRPGTGAGGISIGRAAGVPDPRQSPARPAGTAGLAGRAARPDLAAAVAGQRRRRRRRAVGGRPGSVAAAPRPVLGVAAGADDQLPAGPGRRRRHPAVAGLAAHRREETQACAEHDLLA